MSLTLFVSRWMHPDYPPLPVTDEALGAVEAHFRFLFPDDYREAVQRIGLVSPTIDLLDAIVDRELDMADLSKLLDPAEMVASTDAWRDMGLPGDMVAFGTDCSGNLFCFRTAGGSAIFYFDHDFRTTREIAPSFTKWIEAFCALGED